jgi:hypothetical protein
LAHPNLTYLRFSTFSLFKNILFPDRIALAGKNWPSSPAAVKEFIFIPYATGLKREEK